MLKNQGLKNEDAITAKFRERQSRSPESTSSNFALTDQKSTDKFMIDRKKYSGCANDLLPGKQE